MLQFLVDHKLKLLMGIGTGAVVGTAMYYFSQKKPIKIQTVEAKEQKALTFQQKYARIINKIQDLFDKQQVIAELPAEIVFEIYRGQYVLAQEDAKAEMLRGRAQRRKVFEDRLEYARVVTRSEKNVEEILEKHLNAILARFSIDRGEWTNSINYLCASDDNSEEWEEMVRVEDEKLLLSLLSGSLKPRPYSQIKKILEFKVHQLQILNVEDMALNVGIDETAKFNIVESYIRDLVVKEFCIEEELLNSSVSYLTDDQKETLDQYYTDISALMSNIIFDDPDAIGQREEYEQSAYL